MYLIQVGDNNQIVYGIPYTSSDKHITYLGLWPQVPVKTYGGKPDGFNMDKDLILTAALSEGVVDITRKVKSKSTLFGRLLNLFRGTENERYHNDTATAYRLIPDEGGTNALIQADISIEITPDREPHIETNPETSSRVFFKRIKVYSGMGKGKIQALIMIEPGDKVYIRGVVEDNSLSFASKDISIEWDGNKKRLIVKPIETAVKLKEAKIYR